MATERQEFLHPSAGPSRRDPTKIAIRWRRTAAATEKGALLSRLQLSLVGAPTQPEPGARPLLVVNNTEGLSWAELPQKQVIPNAVLEQLEESELVEWIAAVYRPERVAEGLEGLFCVNPTRLYLSAPAAAALGDVAALGLDLSIDRERSARLPGMVSLRIEDASLVMNRGAVQAAADLAARLERTPGLRPAKDLKFENIPLISPTCGCGPCGAVAAPDACVSTGLQFIPNDPLFAISWGLRQINAPYAWQVSQGDPNITVAVLDQGVELGHPDLNLHPDSWNASTDTPDGSPVGNHGTPCAGIVAQRIDNGQGGAGVAGKCRIMAIATSTWADVDIAEGLYFAADHGARVISMSFGVYPSWGFWDFDLIRTALQYALDRGLVLVAASGNENGGVSRFPGSDARTICIGGSNRDDERKRIGDASIETWWGASYGPDLDVVAPCLEIPATDRLGGAGYDPGDYTTRFNGTSSATPHVAGLAALILSVRPDLHNEEVREIIERTCDKISPPLYAYTLVAGKPNGTWNEETGYGRINVERALEVACDYGKGEKGTCPVPSIDYPCVPKECVAPRAPPWKPFDQCIYWYEPRFVDFQDFVFRIVYEHCLRLLGRQQGPLLYTATLLPGETLKLYHYDRYRRVRSATERVTVHSSLRQTVAALWQTRTKRTEKQFNEVMVKIRSDGDSTITIGGGLFAVSWDIEDPDLTFGTAQSASVESVSESFQQLMLSATQQVDAERSLVVSTYEERDTQDITARTIENHNPCRAVTYFVRCVLECYELHTRVREITWRRRGVRGERWRPLDDLGGLDDAARKRFKSLLDELPRVGAEVRAPTAFTVPTDGALYEAELAHCSSCEPARQVEVGLKLELAKSEARKACLEAELVAMEVERRRALLGRCALTPFAAPVLVTSDS